MSSNPFLGSYVRMDMRTLPRFWLAYLGDPSDSGKIHSDVNARWRNGDADVIAGMQQFADMTSQAKYVQCMYMYIHVHVG